MPSFAEAVQLADETGLPVVEGFAVKMKTGGDEAAVAQRLAPMAPDPKLLEDGWRLYRSGGGDPPELSAAWDIIRELNKLTGVETAEPLLVTRLPVANGSEAERAFRLWGRVSDARLTQILEASDGKNRHWSLEKMRVLDFEESPGVRQLGAWSLWKQRHPDLEPGHGVLVAHPDTGYTRHQRLMPHLQHHPDGDSRFGKNFVERKNPDGLDPMEDRSFGKFPGHGTGTASVIAADASPDDQPWGVAPGAKILPLRVSSSVIHLSFQNVTDALDEAMKRGAHVISMSLGGPLGFGPLNSLVRSALDSGVIIVAAAGNNAPTVMFPARIPGVLACAASNALDAPWRLSGLGAEVAITAPGELVWHDWGHVDAAGNPVNSGQINTSGTSFATANVAGLAALWLSYHGRESLIQHCQNRLELLPFLFRLCLQRSANPEPSFIRGGKGGFGAGIARADRLLQQELPSAAEVAAVRDKILAGAPDGMVSLPASSWWTILNLPTLTEEGPVLVDDPAAVAERRDRLNKLLTGSGGLARSLDADDRAEIGALAAADVGLANALSKAVQGSRGGISGASLRRYLLRKETALSLSLRKKLKRAQATNRKAWNKKHPELSTPYGLPTEQEEQYKIAYAVAAPPTRRLRAFAFDPSLATRSAEAAINEVIIPVVFERALEPGPVGDYLEVVDVDPASDCAYAPVDLNHPFLLAQDGLQRSEGNPQFHQQMVYAVAMKTIRHFEDALGRPLFWSPLRPWNEASGDRGRAEKRSDQHDQFVQHLRLYPHALRDQNAYYSPQKRAILFGYFPAGDGDPGSEYPGGVVFTCLSHDIIAHEMTHAILDGMHVHYTEPSNPDVLAFHEAFADIVALFQRFTYTDLLKDQIARSRGRLDAGTLMTRLALQFGHATGRHQALRDAVGRVVRQGRAKAAAEWRDRREESESEGDGEPTVTIADAARDPSDEENRYYWKRFQADPSLLAEVEEPHERGSFLVAAVFDAYLRIYEDRVADLKRIATGGTGVLPDGDLHPDLVRRMATEASKSAGHVLNMCLRAMDYLPPTDITFGEFLRAIITADFDLVPNDERRYRIAFIEAFRKWGIYPRDVRTLSEETLRWSPPDPKYRALFPSRKSSKGKRSKDSNKLSQDQLKLLRRALFDWQPGEPRRKIFDGIKAAQKMLHGYFKKMPAGAKEALLGGIDTKDHLFQVTNLRPARRIGPSGEFLTEMVVEILQSDDGRHDDDGLDPNSIPFRGGVTLIVGLEKDEYFVRYAIYKRLDSETRRARQQDFQLRARAAGAGGAAEYSADGLPAGWYSQEAVRQLWRAGRTCDPEDMRASSCYCRRSRMAGKDTALTEPFALLHRG